MRHSDDKGEDGKGGYRVGYGKPPVETQFKKGQPQNFHKRRKGTQSRREIVSRLANEPIKVVRNGKKQNLPADEAVLVRIRDQALKSDSKAQALWLKTTRDDVDHMEALNRQNEDEGREARRSLQEKIELMAKRFEAQQAAKKETDRGS